MQWFFSLLMMAYVTSMSGYDVHLCPGESYIIPRVRWYENLYFETGSSKQQVANFTHILLPSYQFKGTKVFIPEVMKKHVGHYYWTSNVPKRVSASVINLFLKDCSFLEELNYGDNLTLMVPMEASVLEFTNPKSADRWILWSRINNDNKRGARGVVKDHHWEAFKITYSDAGRYTFLKESGDEISSTRLVVKELKRIHDISDMSIEGSRIPVPVSEAVLTFTDTNRTKHVLFSNSTVTEEAFKIFGSRINMQIEYDELKLTILDLKSHDKGTYKVFDKNKVLVVTMNVNENKGSSTSNSELIEILAPIGVTGCVLLLCGLGVRRCCTGCKNRDGPVVSSDSQEFHSVHVTSRQEYYPPSAEETERRLWPQSSSFLNRRRTSDPPPYEEVVGNDSVPCPPYSPTAPMEA